MAYKKELEKTANPTVWKKLRKRQLEVKYGVCPFCRPHRGCNARWGYFRQNKTWKKNRKHQWK